MRLNFMVCPALLASAAISCLAPSLAVEQPQTGQPSAVPPGALIYLDLPVHIDARPSPTPVQGDDGARYLVYRVFVTNWSERDLTFQGFDVLDAESGQVLARYDGNERRNALPLEGAVLAFPDP